MFAAGPALVPASECRDQQQGPSELGFGHLIRLDWVVVLYLQHEGATRDPNGVKLALVAASVLSQPDHFH